jgi:arylsulfatase A-like enzyme
MYYVPQLAQVPERLHFSHWVADRSIAFLEDRPRDRPFFLWSSFIDPHPPFAPPAPWHRLYPPLLMDDPHRPAGEPGLLTAHNRQQNRYKFRDGGEDRRLLQLIRAYYLATVSFVDAQVGRILAALERTGGRDSTLVVFSSDHGEFLGDYGSFGKRSFLDVAVRVPLLFSGPGFPRGRSDELVSLLDLLPTFLAVAGATWEDLPLDGRPLHDGAGHDLLPGQFQTGCLGLYQILTRDWKYVYSAADRREYLLDRRRDPGETRNLAYNAYCREALVAMRRRAAAHFGELAGVDFDRTTHNTRVRLGGAPDGERFRSLEIDEDAGGLIVPEPAGPAGEPYARYWPRRED